MAKTLQNKIRRIYAILKKTYGRKKRLTLKDPLDTLIETILSQNTTDKNSHGAFLALKRRFKNWDAVRVAGRSDIARTIRSAGLYRIKSARIKDIIEHIHRVRGTTDLKFLTKMRAAEAESFLKNLKGIGPKTMSIVMLFSLGLPYFPVDTHILRVSKRLGLIPGKSTAGRAHKILGKFVPKNIMYEFHINMIAHGRTLCKAQRPKCEYCPLKGFCLWYREVFIRKRPASPSRATFSLR